MTKEVQDLATRKLAQALSPGEGLKYTTPAATGVIGYVDTDDLFAGLNIQIPSTTTRLDLPEGNVFQDILGEGDDAILSVSS